MQDKRRIHHLYQRAGLGLGPSQWETLSKLTLSEAIRRLFTEAQTITPLSQINLAYMDLLPVERNKVRKEFMRNSAIESWNTNRDWVNLMGNPTISGLREKMTLFWHGHFATRIRHAHSAVTQINHFRTHALGNFRDLLITACHDPALLNFLDANGNRKDNINENFGRELLELFTLGQGNYTQKDVVEASRAFTGWSFKELHHFHFAKETHDNGIKTFLGRTGRFDGNDIINIILSEKTTAQFIVKKLYKYFVSENVDDQRINQLSKYFYESDYDIGKLMKKILHSEWFYQPEIIGTKIKSPMELLAGIMRVFNIQILESESLVKLERNLGQVLFGPPNVAGWKGGKSWVNNHNIYLRLNLARYLAQAFLNSSRLKQQFIVEPDDPNAFKLKFKVSPQQLESTFASLPPSDLKGVLEDYLLSVPTASTINRYFNQGARSERVMYLTLKLMGVPEYQVC